MYRDKLYKFNSPRYRKTEQAILSLICNTAKTKHQLAIEMDLNLSTISNYVYFMKQKRLIYIADWKENLNSKASAMYKFGAEEDKPFVGRKKYKSPPRIKDKPVNLKVPRCDIAAGWLSNPTGDNDVV